MSDHLDLRLREFGDLVGRIDEGVAILLVHELGAFEALLDGPLSVEELGQLCDAAPRRLGAMLDVVVALGFLAREDDGRYALVQGDQRLFDPRDVWVQGLNYASLSDYPTGSGSIEAAGITP